MQKNKIGTTTTRIDLLTNNRNPTASGSGKQPKTESRFFDPSSSSPKGESYPIPNFFEYRIRTKEIETL